MNLMWISTQRQKQENKSPRGERWSEYREDKKMVYLSLQLIQISAREHFTNQISIKHPAHQIISKVQQNKKVGQKEKTNCTKTEHSKCNQI